MSPDTVRCVGLPRWFFTTRSWVLTAVFSARVVGDARWFGLFKRSADTDFAHWDTRLFVPLCALLAIGCAIVALGRNAALAASE